MSLINITPKHFVTADGRPVLSVDQDGYPHVSADMVTQDDKALGEIALALYTNCLPLHASKRNVDLVTAWVRQFKSYT
ncbi:hypothetical protein WL29_23100 [Burkholderia ubonensis]|uniref:Uncharacterized protein n=1 Tax=Burkholderia ubonensis TaxID=101571 RepID=A0A106QD13_9BURK|nr:hypothetical protein [Burkholderia ubonensis]KWA84251.1 hypothetical protein WL29_23100 [Burkholderia ubonensis]